MYADCQSSETLSHVTFDSFLGQQIKILLRLFEAPGQEEFFRKVSMESRHPVSSFEFICRLDANEDNATSSDISDKFLFKARKPNTIQSFDHENVHNEASNVIKKIFIQTFFSAASKVEHLFFIYISHPSSAPRVDNFYYL